MRFYLTIVLKPSANEILSHNSTYSGVCHIYSVRESASRHESQYMEGYQVDKEYITSPGGHLQIK